MIRSGEGHDLMACCGDIPTLETFAAVDFLRHHVPDLQIRVINVVDLILASALRPCAGQRARD
jgi:xylulose-5-phosphate/fructose-6-phosphate phosphoketolase